MVIFHSFLLARLPEVNALTIPHIGDPKGSQAMTPSTPRRQDIAGHFLWVRDVATAAGATDPTGALPGDMALAAERPGTRPSECFITHAQLGDWSRGK